MYTESKPNIPACYNFDFEEKMHYKDVPPTAAFTTNLGVTENHVPGGLTGELFANIMGDGFSRLLQGDRLWFEGRQSGLTSGN